MPEIITIVFDCFPPFEANMFLDPTRLDESERCTDAYHDLIDFMNENHISWFIRDVTRDQMDEEIERLWYAGAKEFAP